MQRCAVRRWPHWIVVPPSVSHTTTSQQHLIRKSWKKVWKLSWMQNAARPYFAGISWTIRFLYLITYSPLPPQLPLPPTSPSYLLAFFIFFTLMETLCVLLQTVAICIIHYSQVSNKWPWSSNQFWPVFNTPFVRDCQLLQKKGTTGLSSCRVLLFETWEYLGWHL